MSSGPLDWKDIKASAAKFINKYKGVSKEASYKQLFWNDFLAMFGVDAIQVGMFEYYVRNLDNRKGEIDYFWPGKMIIEHKSKGKDLDNAMDQAMGYLLQIEDHNAEHPDNRIAPPRYIIVSDFKRFRIMDLVEHTDTTFKLESLVDNVDRFGFLAGYVNKRIEGQHPVNVKAADVMGELYDLLKESGYPDEYLDDYLVRLVFILFAEDAELFDKSYATEYLVTHTNGDGSHFGDELDSIFEVLNTPIKNRMVSISEALSNFPYVNGGLFAERIPKAVFNREMRDCFFRASKLDWKYISPAIFGSLFQCIMDPKKRRELGAHYTSEENILKLINPLFMDDLRTEFESIKKNRRALQQFWEKLADIRVLDPACGCGNFLIISYRELRLLEMDVMEAIYGKQASFDVSHLHVDHFHGIEIEQFPAMIANLAILLMDHIMNLESRNRFGQSRDIIPLREKANIVCENSLLIDWNVAAPFDKLTYIIGNPPFVGGMLMSSIQKKELLAVFDNGKGFGELDYVSAWYAKASKYISKYPQLRVAFVSTNSVVQGEQATILWKYLFGQYGIHFDFAYHTFVWNNEAKGVAAVHCVIIGFSKIEGIKKTLFDEKGSHCVQNINQYLIDAPMIFVDAHNEPLCNVPPIRFGSMPRDGGNLVLFEEDKEYLEKNEPLSVKWIRPYWGADEFLNNKKRWCLWLVGADPTEINRCPTVKKRIQAVKQSRENSKAPATRKFALTPSIFCQIAQPDSDYLLIPRVSSEKREYLPVGFMHSDVIASDLVYLVPDAELFHFGVISSHMHMAWMRRVCGRLKSDYRYSKDIVYNDFPWPNTTEAQKVKIAEAVKDILAIRGKYSNSSIGDLYDPALMPPDLLKAHQKLDGIVDHCYRATPFEDDECRVAYLMELYAELISKRSKS